MSEGGFSSVVQNESNIQKAKDFLWQHVNEKNQELLVWLATQSKLKVKEAIIGIEYSRE